MSLKMARNNYFFMSNTASNDPGQQSIRTEPSVTSDAPVVRNIKGYSNAQLEICSSSKDNILTISERRDSDYTISIKIPKQFEHCSTKTDNNSSSYIFMLCKQIFCQPASAAVQTETQKDIPTTQVTRLEPGYVNAKLDICSSNKDNMLTISERRDSDYTIFIKIPKQLEHCSTKTDKNYSSYVFMLCKPICCQPVSAAVQTETQTDIPTTQATRLEPAVQTETQTDIPTIQATRLEPEKTSIQSGKFSDVSGLLDTIYAEHSDSYKDNHPNETGMKHNASRNSEEMLTTTYNMSKESRTVNINGVRFSKTQFSYKTSCPTDVTFSLVLISLASSIFFSCKAALQYLDKKEASLKVRFRAFKINRTGYNVNISSYEPFTEDQYNIKELIMQFQNLDAESLQITDETPQSETECSISGQEMLTPKTEAEMIENKEGLIEAISFLEDIKSNNDQSSRSFASEGASKHRSRSSYKSKERSVEKADLETTDSRKYSQAQTAWENSEQQSPRTKMKGAKVKYQTGRDLHKYIFITRNESILIALLDDITRTQIVQEGVHDFFNNDLKIQFSRPSIPIPSMHPLLPYKVRYLDELDDDSFNLQASSKSPFEEKDEKNDSKEDR